MDSDADLVLQTTGGDVCAFAGLVARHERTMRAIAYSILRDLHAAEDATQDAFVAAYENLSRLRNPAVFGPWMARILRRHARSLISRRRPTVPIERAANVAAPCGNGLTEPDLEKLLDAVMALPSHERQVMMLRHFDGHDVHAIAEILGRPVGTVTKQLSRGYDRLRHRLREDSI